MLARFANWIRSVFGRYEAGQRWGTSRSQIQGEDRDARYDADHATLSEIRRKARYFERNSPLVNRLADLFEQFTVGSAGMPMVPASSSQEWNAAVGEWWNQWCKVCDVSSLDTFGTMQSIVARSWFIDGEVFIIKTRGDTEPFRPRIQLVEAHRVETPPRLSELEGKSIVDGIAIDSKGRPVGYYIKDDFDSHIFYPARDVVHVFERSRPGQYRGVSFLHPVLNLLHDLDDLQLLTMQVAKDAARITNVIMSESGEQSTSGARKARFGLQTQDSAGNTKTENRVEYYRKILGAQTVALKQGESLEQFRSGRPSPAEREYWDYLTSSICAGVGITKLLVFPWSVQGTVTRADLDVANVFFRSRSAVLASKFENIWTFVIGWAKDYDAKFFDGAKPPADWNKVSTRPPRSVNVDIGRNSAAMIAELAAGTRTLQDTFAENGQDWREQITQRAKEEAFINQVASEHGIDPARIRDAVQIASQSAPGDSGPSEIDVIKAQFDAYGVGVRAGAITPTSDDENAFRKNLGLPAINPDVAKAWKDDGNVRRPITLVQPGATQPAPQFDPNANT